MTFASAQEMSEAVRSGRTTARETIEQTLARIAARADLNAFTQVLAERALDQADSLDADRAAGRPLGPLAGVPFAVKNLFDFTYADFTLETYDPHPALKAPVAV